VIYKVKLFINILLFLFFISNERWEFVIHYMFADFSLHDVSSILPSQFWVQMHFRIQFFMKHERHIRFLNNCLFLLDAMQEQIWTSGHNLLQRHW